VQDEISNSDFSILRIVFSVKTYKLEMGSLQEGEMRYSPIGQSALPFDFTPNVVKDDANLKSVADAIKETYPESIGKTDRIAIVFQQNWGNSREVILPRKLPDEERIQHLIWTLRTTGWQDNEPLRYNYRQVNDDTVFAVAIRERVLQFAKALALELSGRLIQLSLADTDNLNIISDIPEPLVPGTGVKALPSETIPELAEIPGEEPLTEKKSQKKFRAGILFPIILVLLLGFAGYYFILVKKISITSEISRHKRLYELVQYRMQQQARLPNLIAEPAPSPTVEPAPIVDSTQVKVDTTTLASKIDTVKTVPTAIDTMKSSATKPEAIVKKAEPKMPSPTVESRTPSPTSAGPFSDIFSTIASNSRIGFITFTLSDLRCELYVDTKSNFEGLLQQLRASGYIESAAWAQKGIYEDKLGGILFGKLKQKPFLNYQRPAKSQVDSLFQASGYTIKDNSFQGASKEIHTILSLLDQQHLLFYRLLIESTDGHYKLTLQY
jgi:hypothetical protein